MQLARDSAALKRRIDDYLWHEEAMPVVKLRALLNEHFLPFEHVAIVGGLARDFARYGKRGFRSDVDLVIQAPTDSVTELAQHLGAKPNRFGGFAYSHPHWKIDFWALETTWAVRQGHAAAASLADVADCTFFDCDAILYDLNRRTIIADCKYFERLSKNQIEIQLEPNPSIEGNLLRAVRRLLFWSARPGYRLSEFIERNLTDESFARISAVEHSAYGNRVMPRFRDFQCLKRHIFDPEARRAIDTHFGEQLHFPGF